MTHLDKHSRLVGCCNEPVCFLYCGSNRLFDEDILAGQYTIHCHLIMKCSRSDNAHSIHFVKEFSIIGICFAPVLYRNLTGPLSVRVDNGNHPDILEFCKNTGMVLSQVPYSYYSYLEHFAVFDLCPFIIFKIRFLVVLNPSFLSTPSISGVAICLIRRSLIPSSAILMSAFF